MKYKMGAFQASLHMGITWRTLKNTEAYPRNSDLIAFGCGMDIEILKTSQVILNCSLGWDLPVEEIVPPIFTFDSAHLQL